MKLIFYTFAKKLNSTAQPADTGRAVDGEISEPWSTLTPTIIVSSAAYNVEYNYVHIPALNRYYYIGNWRYSAGRYYADCNVDVLASWRADILAQTRYVIRSASECDPNIINTQPVITAPVSAVKVGIVSPYNPEGSIVLGVIGGGDNSQLGGPTYYVCSTVQFRAFYKAILSAPPVDEGVQLEVSTTMAKMLYNPCQYVVSAVYVPYSPETSGSDTIKCGYYDSGVTAPLLSTINTKITSIIDEIPQHPQIDDKHKYLMSTTYTKAVLHYPPFADIQLPSLVNATRITLTLHPDAVSGQARLYVDIAYSDKSSWRGVYYATISSTMLLAQVQPNFVSGFWTMLARAGGMGLESFMQGSSIVDAIGDTVMTPPGILNSVCEFSVSTSGSQMQVLNPDMECYIQYMYCMITEEDATNHGRPLMQYRQLSTLSGYVQTGAGGAPAIPATNTEITQIESRLTGGGIYLE